MRKCVVLYGVVKRLPEVPNSILSVSSDRRSIWPRIEFSLMCVIYLMSLRIPWVRYMQGICNPRLESVPCLIARGILLQKPAACRPVW